MATIERTEEILDNLCILLGKYIAANSVPDKKVIKMYKEQIHKYEQKLYNLYYLHGIPKRKLSRHHFGYL